MDVKELAERLKKIESNGHMETFSTVMFQNRKLIQKCLETVAGIEMLKDDLYSVEYIPDEWRVTLSLGIYCGTDLHSAVRAAVEAAGKGE